MKIINNHGLQDNICNTPEIATIELHHNKYGTGEYFSTFITHNGSPMDGYWTDGLLSENEVKGILSILRLSEARLRTARENEDE